MKTRRESIIEKGGHGFEIGSFEDGLTIHFDQHSIVNHGKPTVIVSGGHSFWPLTVDNIDGFADFWDDILELASKHGCVITTETEG